MDEEDWDDKNDDWDEVSFDLEIENDRKLDF